MGRTMQNAPIPPKICLARIFENRSARDGAVVRRKVRDVERYTGREVLLAEFRRRGYSAVENAGQFVIFRDRDAIRRVA